MTTRSVQYPVADRAGELVWADQLAVAGQRPEDLACVSCAAPVRLRAGERNRPHFAHHHTDACTAPETVLHATTMRVLRDGILAASAAGDRYSLDVSCERCGIEAEGNLARHTDCTIDMDKAFVDGIRPDLLIRGGADNAPRYVIEVVVTHAPEPAALVAYAKHGLPVVIVWPTWETLPQIRDGLTAPHRRHSGRGIFDVIDACRSSRHHEPGTPPCAQCTRPSRAVSVEIAAIECYRCHRNVRVLDIVNCSNQFLRTIAAICPDLRNVKPIAADRNVALSWSRSQTAGGSYLMHHCACGAKQGDNFLYASGAKTDTTEPGWAWHVCERGHWNLDRRIAWLAGAHIERHLPAVGLIGEPAGIFQPDQRAGASVQHLSRDDIRTMTRRMLGL